MHRNMNKYVVHKCVEFLVREDNTDLDTSKCIPVEIPLVDPVF